MKPSMKNLFAISSDGTHIAYDVTGQGPFLMLLHGAGKDRQAWHKLGYVERLKHDFTVITVDIRGSGESDFLTKIDDYDIEKICGDISAVANAFRCPVLLLVGTRHTGVLKWVNSNRELLERANILVEIVEGLNHPEEFSQIERVYLVVSSFLISYSTRKPTCV